MLRKYKNRFAFVSLMVMFLFKIVSVQTYSHENHHRAQEAYSSDNENTAADHDEECEVCITLFEAALTPFACEPAPVFDVLPVLLTKKEAKKLPKLLFTKDLFASDLSNRPPPSFS